MAGVEPRWNQGDSKESQIGEGKSYLYRNIKEIKKKQCSRKIKWKKEAE